MNEDVQVLLVTSDPGILDSRAEALESAGYRSASASTGEEGLRLARDIRPDLMVVEAPLPDVRPAEICRRVRGEPPLRDIFLVLLTNAHGEPGRGISALDAEADVVLSRPIGKGELVTLVASFLRIQRTEEKLRASEARYRDVVENAPLGIYRTTPDGDILMANSALVEMLGYDSFADLARRDLESEGYHPDYPRAEFKRRMEEDGQVRGLEAAWERKDGSTLYVRENARAVRDERGDLICYQGTVEDVTERVMHARRLKRLNAVLATIRGVNEVITHEHDRSKLIEAACIRLVDNGVYETAWIGLLDEDNRLTEGAEKGLGDAFAAITERLSQGETCVCGDQALATKDVCVCDAPDEEPLAEVYQNQRLMAVRLAQGGDIFGLLTVSVPIELEIDEREKELLEETANDIAFALRTIDLEEEQRQAHQALQTSERRQSLILNATTELFTYINPDLEIQWVNQAAARAMGLPPEDLVGRHCYEVWALRQAPCEGCPVRKALETGEAHEAERRTPDGRFWHMRAYPVFDEDGEIEGLVELSQEITDRERTRRALLASEKRYRVLFESTGTATLVYRDDGVIQLCNERFAALAGLPKEEIEGRLHWSEFVHPEELERLERYHAQRTRRQGDPPTEYEFTFVNAQGETREVYIHIGLLEETGERVASLTDVTPLKEAQEALRESEERYRLHFENVSDVLYAIDRNFVLADVSPSVERLIGYRPEELIGERFEDLNLLPPEYLEQAAADTKRVMRGKRASSVYQFVARDGTLKWGEVSSAPLVRDGRVTAMIGVARDITERKRAQEALKESRTRLLTILNSIDAHIYAADMDSHEILFMNQQMRDDFGGDRSGEICYEAFRDRQSPCPHCTNDELVDDEGHPTGVHVWEGHNPVTDRWYINHDRAVEWVDGRIVRLQIATDITERRRTEEALRESQLKFRLVTDSIEDVFWMRTCDLEDTIYVSPGYETMWQRSRETLYRSPQSFMEAIHRHDLDGYRDVLETCHRQGEPYETEYRILVDDSDARWIHERGYPVRHPEDGTQLMAGVCTDVTARKEAERALRHAETRYRNLVERIPAVTYVAALDDVGSTLYVSPQVETLWGYSSEEWMADPTLWSQRIHPDDRQRVFDAWERSTTTGEPFRVEYRILHRDGRVLWARDEAVVVQDEAGEPQYVHGVVRDVTERKRAEQERERLAAQVRDQARTMEQILATVPTGVLLLGGGGRVLQANPTGQSDLKELASAEVGDVITRLGDRRLDDLLTSPPEGLWHEVETDSRTFEAIARPVEPRGDGPGPNGPGRDHWVLVVNDVTRERRIDAQLHQQERLAAVGQLAGGIAHDFNNILASIILYAQLPLSQPDLAARTERALETVLEEADRAADLVQQILDFSRKAMMETKPVSLASLVNEALALLRRTIPENIRLVADLPSQPCIVQGDATRIHQVLMNLALNAKDAMPEGGELSIQVEPVTVGPDDEPPVPEMQPGPWARLTVADTGTGMTREVQDHLFEPFFTTKPEGKGTGLGLAQVYGIVKQHQGFIDVETALGEGTTFSVFLALDQETGADEGPEEDALALQGQGETILVVEDAKRLRMAIRAGLESAGYEVIPAANGLEAMELISDGGVDLVLTDVVMPQMGGEALLRNVRENHPDLKVIAMTGHVMDADIEGLEDAGFSDALPKPFSIEELSRVVRDVLDE